MRAVLPFYRENNETNYSRVELLARRNRLRKNQLRNGMNLEFRRIKYCEISVRSRNILEFRVCHAFIWTDTKRSKCKILKMEERQSC